MSVFAEITPLFDALSLKSGGDSNDHSEFVSRVQDQPRLLPAFCEHLASEVAKTGKGSETAIQNALNVFGILTNECVLFAEPYICLHLPAILFATTHKNAKVRTAAEETAKLIVGKISPNASKVVLDHLYVAAEPGNQWQLRAVALNLIASFGDHAPEQLGVNLPDVIPQVTRSMHDPKKDISKAAFDAMTTACDVVGNRDIEHMTPKIVRAIMNQNEVNEIMHDLAGVTFVQSVQSPALAMVVPLLIRGLRSNKTATRRQSAVIIDNMSKLVDDPLDAAPFLPTLLPALAFAADAMSDPEARQVAENATAQLTKLNTICERLVQQNHGINHTQVRDMLLKKLPALDFELCVSHIAHLICSLMHLRKFEREDWVEITNYTVGLLQMTKAHAEQIVEEMRVACKELVKIVDLDGEDDDDAEELCNCQFTLAYGTKILLHNTNMRLKRGAKYGLLGGNDSGKTTLMRSIANGSVEGFPDPATVRTVFVEADILGELSHLSCVDYIMQDPRLAGCNRNEVLSVLATVGFTEDGKAKPFHSVSTLSGGWRMKLALARAMLQRADILLLDEPTNHLDVINVAWVKNYINSLKNVTAIMVSHDKGFLNDCCTDILQIERLKLRHFRGNLDKFMTTNPDAKGFFNLRECKLKFTFPQPGPIEGVKSRSKALMKMSHCFFTYPGNTTPTLFDITIQVSMASRVGCVGENGAGKSTMIKLLTGELIPQQGEVWKNPNTRVAYVAQHAFHHIEQHLHTKTANEYIRWRYANGEDKESLAKVSMVLTEEEKELQRQPIEVNWKDEDGKQHKANKIIIELTGTRHESKSKEYEYECKFRDGSELFLPYRQLQRAGWDKACRAIDARIAQRAGQYVRTLSSANVEKHLSDCGLEAEFATHYRMNALSGGQKVKVVMAAAMWNQPHILILDEPTNYLDRESLGALANAISEFEGGVVIISHNNEFVSTLCPEEWVMDAGHLTTRGEVGWMNRQDDKISDAPVITEMVDALGNVTEVKQPKKTLSKRDEKAAIKSLKAKIKAKEELDEDEEELAMKHNLL